MSTILQDFRSDIGLYSTSSQLGEISGSAARQALDAVNQRRPGGQEQTNHLLWKLYSKATTAQPTEAHWLIEELYLLSRLQRHYTQNIDGLDEELSTPRVDFTHSVSAVKGKVIQLHGSIRWFKCTKCHWRGVATREQAEALWLKNEVIPCTACQKGK